MKKKEPQTFNQKLQRLEDISVMLEDDSIELEQAIALYEEGSGLAAECLEKLKAAELTVTQIQQRLQKQEQAEGEEE